MTGFLRLEREIGMISVKLGTLCPIGYDAIKSSISQKWQQISTLSKIQNIGHFSWETFGDIFKVICQVLFDLLPQGHKYIFKNDQNLK